VAGARISSPIEQPLAAALDRCAGPYAAVRPLLLVVSQLSFVLLFLGQSSTSRLQVVTADEASSEVWLDDEYQLGPKVRDVRDHGALRMLLPVSCLICCFTQNRHPGVGGHRPHRRPPFTMVSAGASITKLLEL